METTAKTKKSSRRRGHEEKKEKEKEKEERYYVVGHFCPPPPRRRNIIIIVAVKILRLTLLELRDVLSRSAPRRARKRECASPAPARSRWSRTTAVGKALLKAVANEGGFGGRHAFPLRREDTYASRDGEPREKQRHRSTRRTRRAGLGALCCRPRCCQHTPAR